MAGASSFVLRWEIDNVVAKSATGRMESGVFDKGGFEWTIKAERVLGFFGSNDTAKFTLSCDADGDKPWKCEAHITMCLISSNGAHVAFLNKTRFCFDENICSFEHRNNNVHWEYFNSNAHGYVNNGKVIVEFVIDVISSDSGKPIFDSINFESPNNRSDVILVIGDKKLHVSKELLAINSPVFETMFFGDFAENGKEEVEIKDVNYEEFVDLLYMIYPGAFLISDATVIHLLALSDRFQVKHVHHPAQAHLRNSKRFTTAQKLAVADKYNLNGLRDYCIHTYTASQSIAELESTPEYASFSADMKAAICDRVMKLLKDKK